MSGRVSVRKKTGYLCGSVKKVNSAAKIFLFFYYFSPHIVKFRFGSSIKGCYPTDLLKIFIFENVIPNLCFLIIYKIKIFVSILLLVHFSLFHEGIICRKGKMRENFSLSGHFS